MFCVVAILRAVATMTMSNSYFAILLMSKSLVSSKVLNLEVFHQILFSYFLMICDMGIFRALDPQLTE